MFGLKPIKLTTNVVILYKGDVFMANASFKNLNYEHSTSGVRGGFKNHYTPRNALYGGNGTFRLYTPSELTLTLHSDDGKIIRKEISSLFKNVNGFQKLSDKRVDALESKLKNVDHFEVDDNGYIVGLKDIIKI